MALFSRFRSQISIGLVIFGLGLLALLAWFIYRTVHLHNLYTSSVSYSCATTGVPTLVDIQSDSYDYAVLIYNSFVEILTDTGTKTGIEDTCLIGVSCLQWHYSGSFFNCDVVDTFPETVQCWTSSEQSTPVCTQPGSDWHSALTGTILTGIFAIALLILAFTVDRSFRNAPSPTRVDNGEFEVVGVVMTTQPLPVVRAESPTIVRPPSPIISARDVKVV